MNDAAPFAAANQRHWMRAGLFLGGGYAWTTAVFGGLAEYQLLTGGSAAFGLVLTLGIVTARSIRKTYGTKAATAGEAMRRWLVAVPFGLFVWLGLVFFTAVLCERNAEPALMLLGLLGILTVFLVSVVARKHAPPVPRQEPALRAIHALAWSTILLVTSTALLPPLAHAMRDRGRRSAGATTASVNE